jgi:hypothetical protein
MSFGCPTLGDRASIIADRKTRRRVGTVDAYGRSVTASCSVVAAPHDLDVPLRHR